MATLILIWTNDPSELVGLRIQGLFLHIARCFWFLRCVRKVGMSNYQVLRVCPSVRMEQLSSHQTDFHEILYLSIFRKYVTKIQTSLTSDKNNQHFTRRPIHIFLVDGVVPVMLGRMAQSSVVCQSVCLDLRCTETLWCLQYSRC